MSEKKIAVGYIRCSTDEQIATSIPQQKHEIEKWASANNFKIVDWFSDEGKSGTDFLQRPAFVRLVKRVENKADFQYVLVYDESRWGRALNPRENAYWKIHLERHGVKVRVLNSNSKNEDDIGSYVVEVVESAEASEYSRKLSRSIRRGMLSEQQGKFSRGGTSPYGYIRVAIDLQTNEKRILRHGMRSSPRQEKVVWELGDKIEVKTVKRIYEMKANAYGYVAIADFLNKEGIPSPGRGRWHGKDQKWAGVTIRDIIRNPCYKGDRVYNRLSFSKFAAREKGNEFRPKMHNDKSEWIVVGNAHPAIISRELFERANISSEKYPVKPNQHLYRSNYLLTGLIKCSHCNFNFQGYTHTQTGNKYYVDGGYVNKGKSVCNWFSIKKDVLESSVIKGVKELILNPLMVEKIIQRVKELTENKAGVFARELENIEGKLKETKIKINNLVAIAEQGINLESIALRLRELENEEKQLRITREKLLSQEHEKVDISRLKSSLSEFYRKIEDVLEKAEITEKKRLIRMLVEKIVVDREQGKVKSYLRKLPDLPQMGFLNKESKESFGVMSVALTGIEPVFQP